MYCLFELVEYTHAYAYGYLQKNSAQNGDSFGCKVFVIGRQTLALYCGWSIALVAIARTFNFVNERLWKIVSVSKNAIVICIFACILPFVVSVPIWFEKGIEFKIGRGNNTGYFCFPVQDGIRVTFTELSDYLIVTQDCLIMDIVVISFVILALHVRRNTKIAKIIVKHTATNVDRNLRESNYKRLVDKVKEVETQALRLTITLGIICFTYIIM